MVSPLLETAIEIVALACLLRGAVRDVVSRTIPNGLVLAVMAAGVILKLLGAPALILPGVVIWIASLVGLGVLASLRVIGWGDAKLIAAVTLLVIPSRVPPLLLVIVLAGGILALLYLAAGWVLRHRQIIEAEPSSAADIAAILAREARRAKAHCYLPYGVAVFGGTAFFVTTEAARCWPAISCSL